MTETTFTFQVDKTLKEQFIAAAESSNRDAAQLLRDFMWDFVQQQQDVAEYDACFARQVQIGIDAANAGHLTPSEEVEARFSAKRAAARRRLEAEQNQ